MNVLHIEDRRENRLLVRKLLEARGFSVTDAADGLTGVELARSTQPDLILVDINIPGLDGYQVDTRLRGDPKLVKTPIVAITAEGDRGRALSLGFDGFITKPIKLAAFVGQLEGFLAGDKESIGEKEKVAHLTDEHQRVVNQLETQVRQLTQVNDRLREVDRLKMEVLRNVSHELATPMTPLKGYVKMLAGAEMGPVTDAQAQILQRMSRSLGRLHGIIDNLLNVTRFATGAVSLERVFVHPARVLTRALEASRDEAGRRRVLLQMDPPAGEPVFGDEERLVDALRAIIDNAIKFGPEGGQVRVGAQLLVEGEGDRRLVEFAVSDQGPGIPPAEREQVCQPFYQVDGSATRAVGGAGLGLAIAERTASLHGGTLVITDGGAGGARVAIRVPTRPT